MLAVSPLDAPMDPSDALDRVAHLIERGLGSSRKAAAFRTAADALRAAGDDEVRRLHAAGRLTALDGVGASTAAVAAEALDGGVPERLADLEATTVVPDGDGAELRAALRGDCHSHSTWSDGGAPIVDMARAAMALGHEYLVLTDHSPRLTVARGLNRERLEAQLEEIAALNEELAPFRILTGVEVDIFPDGTLDGDDDMLDRLDVVVASVHSKLSMGRTEMTQRMVKAVLDPRVDILGHCTGRKLKGLPDPGPEHIPASAYVRQQSHFDPEVVFAACEATDTAVEINCRPERRDPPDELLALAVDVGCWISIDTDAHAPAQLEWQPYGCDKAVRHGLGPDRVVNTWAADDLLAWTEA
ncbi:PHP domain-containing protein [Iamia majanohamensis]|uniref:PHP domain-containing protein n=2 Tax=Iamia majanohamensis TaxID=467976 RepID=A0AAF0BU77_9ACTN|nr:PHP domain-containing protein [Iamia majanohamensis]WCO65560.1 PHP domain-containing protein [Iamia majanohamensis]